MNNKVLKLFETCILTIGHQRSILVDNQRDCYYFIPNSLAQLFDKNHILQTKAIVPSDENNEILDEYIAFLLEKELCFYCDENMVSHFPALDITEWDYPAKITNAIVEIDVDNFEHHFRLLEELTDTFFTRSIELYLPHPVNYKRLSGVLNRIDQLDLYNYNIIFELKDNAELADVVSLLRSSYKIFRAIISKAGKTEILESDRCGWGNIVLIEDQFSYKDCGITDAYNFCHTLSHITESASYNTCLNRKVFIDLDGNIKNCPNMPIVQGNIHREKLSSVFSKEDFTKYWSIKKDDIKVCRDCEFRHICTDCRAFVETPDDIYSKPLKCGYDPYTCEWEDWSTNALKQKALTYYQLSPTSIANSQ